MKKFVSLVGREELIKAIAQAILTYVMNVFRFSKDLPQTIQATLDWLRVGGGKGHKQDKRKMNWLSNSKLCLGKDDEGLGF